jgi:YD repeat-containing protein
MFKGWRVAGLFLMGFMALLALAGPAGAVTYTYDQLGRVTSADYGGGKTVTYVYDPAGNRTASTAGIPYPAFSISGGSATEGGAVTFTVTKVNKDGLSHSVNYATASGTATTGTDFTAATGTLTFADADTSKTFTVTTATDAVVEGSEAFTASLSAPTGGATISTTTATATATIYDPAPVFSISGGSATEGGLVTFTVTKTGRDTLAHSINYATASGTATSGADFTVASGTLSFADGDTSKTFTVATTVDAITEVSETFTASLSAPTGGATISTTTATGTILDPPPVFSISGGSATEGGLVTFTVTKTGSDGNAHSVNYATASGTATSGTDFTAASGTLAFAAGDTSKTFTVTTATDALVEGSETFAASLSGATGGATISTATATGTILDPPPSFSISGGSVVAGNSVTFTVTKTGNDTLSHSVNYATSNGTAIAGSDYTTASATLTFAATDTSKTFTVATIINPAATTARTFTSTLSGATGGATLGTASAIGTITQPTVVTLTDTAGTMLAGPSTYYSSAIDNCGNVFGVIICTFHINKKYGDLSRVYLASYVPAGSACGPANSAATGYTQVSSCSVQATFAVYGK